MPKMCTLFCLVQIKRRSYLTSCVFGSVVGQNIAFHAAPAGRTSDYLVSALPDSLNFVFQKPLRSSAVGTCHKDCIRVLLVVAIYFVSP